MTEFASAFHNRAKHLVIIAAREEDFPGVEFEKCTANRPDIDCEVVGSAKHWNIYVSECVEDENLGDILISGAL